MRRRARSGSRAAAVFEAALVAPLLLVIVVGIVEMALLMRDTVATSSAVRTAASVGAEQAGTGPADCAGEAPCSATGMPAVAEAAAEAIERAGDAIAKDDIDWVIVYQANSKGFPLPESNRDRLVCTTNCVRYVWDEDDEDLRYAGGSWPSASIDACAADARRTAVGVAMQARHSWVTGIFGRSVAMDERSVRPIAALPADACKPGRHL